MEIILVYVYLGFVDFKKMKLSLFDFFQHGSKEYYFLKQSRYGFLF